MQAQTEPMAKPACRRGLYFGWVDVFGRFDGDFHGLEAPLLNVGKSWVLSVVNGEVNRKVLMPIS